MKKEVKKEAKPVIKKVEVPPAAREETLHTERTDDSTRTKLNKRRRKAAKGKSDPKQESAKNLLQPDYDANGKIELS